MFGFFHINTYLLFSFQYFRYAEFDSIKIGSEADQFKLQLGPLLINNAGDGGFSTFQNESTFHTKDKDTPSGCANTWNGGWWYKEVNGECSDSILTGGNSSRGNIYSNSFWKTKDNTVKALKRVVMRIMPKYRNSAGEC